MLQWFALQPQQTAETARITIAQRYIPEYQIKMIVHHRRLYRFDNAQAAGHAQVNQRAAAGELQQQIFAPSADIQQGLLLDKLGQVRGNGPAQARMANAYGSDFALNNMGRNPAQGGFYFR